MDLEDEEPIVIKMEDFDCSDFEEEEDPLYNDQFEIPSGDSILRHRLLQDEGKHNNHNIDEGKEVVFIGGAVPSSSVTTTSTRSRKQTLTSKADLPPPYTSMSYFACHICNNHFLNFKQLTEHFKHQHSKRGQEFIVISPKSRNAVNTSENKESPGIVIKEKEDKYVNERMRRKELRHRFEGLRKLVSGLRPNSSKVKILNKATTSVQKLRETEDNLVKEKVELNKRNQELKATLSDLLFYQKQWSKRRMAQLSHSERVPDKPVSETIQFWAG